jgi:hypothetical protein
MMIGRLRRAQGPKGAVYTCKLYKAEAFGIGEPVVTAFARSGAGVIGAVFHHPIPAHETEVFG